MKPFHIFREIRTSFGVEDRCHNTRINKTRELLSASLRTARQREPIYHGITHHIGAYLPVRVTLANHTDVLGREAEVCKDRQLRLIRNPTEQCCNHRLDGFASRPVIICDRCQNEGAEAEVGEAAPCPLAADANALDGPTNCLWPNAEREPSISDLPRKLQRLGAVAPR